MQEEKETLKKIDEKISKLSPKDKQIKKQLRAIQKQVKELRQRIDIDEKQKKIYAHKMLDLVKRRQINVHHNKRKVRVAPWTTGYERTKEQQEIEKEKESKKIKTRK